MGIDRIDLRICQISLLHTYKILHTILTMGTNDIYLAIEDFEGQYRTRTDETKAEYLKRSRQLMSRAKRELFLKSSDNLDVRQFASWLAGIKSTINHSSWRQYKSAVLYFLEQYQQDPIAAQEAIEFLKHEFSNGTVKFTNKTSSLKLKKIRIDDWNKLEQFLTTKTHKWNLPVLAWLRSAIITGLRPIEWKNARFDTLEGEPVLKIKNAKKTNNRAHGETRTLLLRNVGADDIATIREHLNNIRIFNEMGDYDSFYRSCTLALQRANKSCWPRRKKHITLYSARHQFTANAKSSGINRTEIAAMMGHAVDTTAHEHYAKSQSGNEYMSVMPLQSDVANVRKVAYEDIGQQMRAKETNSQPSKHTGTKQATTSQMSSRGKKD